VFTSSSSDTPARPVLRVRLRVSFSQTRRTLALVWRSWPLGTVVLTALTVLSASLSPAIAYVGKIIVDGVVTTRAAGEARSAAAFDAVLVWVVVELGLIIVAALCDRLLGLMRQLLGGRLGIDVNVMILEKALTLKLRHFEDPEFYDKLTRARREASSRPMSLVQGHFQLLRHGLTVAGYITLLVGFSAWIVPILLLTTVPAFVVEARFSGAGFRLRNRRAPEARRLNYLEHVIANDRHAKEVKLFGLGPLLLGRYRGLSETFYAEDRRLGVRRSIWGWSVSLLSTIAFYGCYAFIALATVMGQLSLGDMTLYVVAFRQGQQAFHAILITIGGMYEDTLYISNLFEYLNISVEDGANGTSSADAAPAARAERGLRFEAVGFRYPGADSWTMRGLNLFIPGGESLALVGENGAGKTTFIKLLTGLYRPNEGRILLDGRDLREWDEEALRRRMGVIFQDFNQYYFLLRENIAVGSVEHLGDEARIANAVDRGGARELVARLAHGLDTQLGRSFHDGIELSGGQWQKVALARAFMRQEADILVLDEPTAALDAEAEHAVFQRFRALAERRTTILISHRFPTVRMADRILVFDRGRVIEDGTHAQLLAQQGRYARLFTLQAQGYS
jgi:ATP-binding cassette, subfamily B, bacterial